MAPTCGCVAGWGRPVCWGLQDTGAGTHWAPGEGLPGDGGWGPAWAPHLYATARWPHTGPPENRHVAHCSHPPPAQTHTCLGSNNCNLTAWMTAKSKKDSGHSGNENYEQYYFKDERAPTSLNLNGDYIKMQYVTLFILCWKYNTTFL